MLTYLNCWVKVLERHPTTWKEFFTFDITGFKFNAACKGIQNS